MSPRKVRLVAGLIRGLETGKALDQLAFANKAAAKPMLKLVKSAIANAVNNFNLKEDNLKIAAVSVDGGPVLKRWTPKAHGRATPIRKRTSHVNLVLEEITDTGVHAAKKVKVDSPVKLSGKPTEDEGVKLTDKDDQEKTEFSEAKEDKTKNRRSPRSDARGGHANPPLSGEAGKTKRLFQRKSG